MLANFNSKLIFLSYTDSRPGSKTSVGSNRPSTAFIDPNVEKSSPSSRKSSAISSQSRKSSALLPTPSRGASAGSSRPSSGTSEAWSDKEPIKEQPKEGDENDAIVEEGGSLYEEEIDDKPFKGPDDIPKGCWDKLTSCLVQLWSQKGNEGNIDREFEIRTTIRELVIYLLFVTTLLVLTFNTSNYRYHMNNIIKQHLEDKFEDVEQVPDLWHWLEKEFIPAVYDDKWYNSGDLGIPCPDGSTTGSCVRTQADKNFLYENRMLGVPRLRMLKVRNDSCSVPPSFAENIAVCYGKYSESIEDRRRFSPGNLKFTHTDAWRFQSSKELETGNFWGKLGWYGGGGNVQNLHTTKDRSEKIIRELREFLWIDRGTRLLVVDLTFYNANVNYFSVIKIFFEFPPTGGLVKGIDMRTVKLVRYVNNSDYFTMGFEVIFSILVLYYCVEELLELSKKKFEYLRNVWNIMDISLILVSLFSIGLSVYFELVIGYYLKPLLAEPELFGNFENLSWWNEFVSIIFAINIYFCWLKIFKYISFNRTMVQLQCTLGRCAPDVLAFLFMFQIIFMAFAQFAYLIFGAKLDYFSTVIDSAFTLMRAMLGDFDFPALQGAHYFFGPMFFFMYIFIVFFILLNMFLAIINDTYSEVKAEMEESKVQFEISDFFARGYNNILGTVAMRDKMIDIENAIKLANSDGIVTYEEVRQQLKKCDFSNQEIELFFNKSDSNGDGLLDIRESGEFVEDCCDDDVDEMYKSEDGAISMLDDEEKEKPVTNAEFDVLELKVLKLERTLGTVIDKIDSVLERMEGFSSRPPTSQKLEEAGNATFMLDMTENGQIEDFVPGDGDEGNATFA